MTRWKEGINIMANTFLTLSTVSLVLAVGLLIGTCVLFFMLDVRGAYAEIHNNREENKVILGKTRRKKSKYNHHSEMSQEETTEKMLIDDEAHTVSEDGEVRDQSLVSFYEPGTEVMTEQMEEKTEGETEVLEEEMTEEVTCVEREWTEINDEECLSDIDFIITKHESYTCSDEIIK